MTAPHLNRALILEGPVRLPDGAGGFTAGWAALGTLWADVTAGTASETRGIGAPLSRTVHKITVRAAPVSAPSRPKADQRFREGTRLHKILSVTERDPGGRFLICLTEEETVA
jgi:head-tail adaptor